MQINNESELVKQAQSGDSGAISILWDAINPKLFGYLINTLKDKTLAEDILQSTWLKAINALPKFQAKGYGFSAWLFAIALNECRQYWRKHKEDSLEEMGVDIAEVQEPSSDINLLVESILKQLGKEDAEILRLRYIADLPINEVAKVLNINPIAARVRLHRILKRAKSLT
jgi:RNA polymerase sigma-70 factor (ECF subfamily)